MIDGSWTDAFRNVMAGGGAVPPEEDDEDEEDELELELPLPPPPQPASARLAIMQALRINPVIFMAGKVPDSAHGSNAQTARLRYQLSE